MKPLVPVLALLFTASAALAQGHDHGPGDGHNHGPASPAPSPSPSLPPPSPEERVELERLSKLKGTQPQSAAEEATLRTQYAEALGQYVTKFPESPRAPFALEAALKLLVGTGEGARGEKLAALFLEKAQKPETKAMARRQILQVMKFGGQPEKAVTFAKEQIKANPNAPDSEWYVYEAAGIQVEQGKHEDGVKILDDWIAANPKSNSRAKFTLRAADFLIGGGKPADAIARLEAFGKEPHAPDDTALGQYFLGVANLSASRTATGDAAANYRKAALAAFDVLMAASRKDPKANRPYGGMAFGSAADVHLVAGDIPAAMKVFEEMKTVFKGEPEAGFAERSIADGVFLGCDFEDVAGTDTEGKPVKSQDFRGKILLVDFFSATFGGYPSVLSLEKKISKKLAGKPFAILGVNLDRKELAEPVRGFVKQVGIEWPVLFDGAGFEGPIARNHNITGMPANFLVDENGVVLRVNLQGPHLEDVISQEVARVEKKLPSLFKAGTKTKFTPPTPAPVGPPSPIPAPSASPSPK